jgi:hypothetical protein
MRVKASLERIKRPTDGSSLADAMLTTLPTAPLRWARGWHAKDIQEVFTESGDQVTPPSRARRGPLCSVQKTHQSKHCMKFGGYLRPKQ